LWVHFDRCWSVLTSIVPLNSLLFQRSPENPNRVHITTANAGDSRIVLGYEGQGIRLTHDHCMDDPLEVARIEKAGGFLFKGRVLGVLAVTRSLGDHMLKDYVIAHPTVNERTLELNELTNNSNNSNRCAAPTFLIIACDGLWDVIRDQEAVNLVQQYPGEKTSVAQYLVEEALRRGSTDNVTAIVAWL
jgi:serine/threonine protein phosphatase PrpC